MTTEANANSRIVSVPMVGLIVVIMPYAIPAIATVPNAIAAAMPNTCR